MQRREVYATTGSRMSVRFFGGWDYKPADVEMPDYVQVGYRKGVPMGGDLRSAKRRQVPTFIVAAVKDPEGPNLDRVQIVKGWVDDDGTEQEKVYDVVWSGDRTPDPDTGKVPPVGIYRQHTGCELHQYHRGCAVGGSLGRSSVRSPSTCVLLRTCLGDPATAVDSIRCEVLRAGLTRGSSHGDSRSRVYQSHLVHTLDWFVALHWLG